jgi:hypothetical protein
LYLHDALVIAPRGVAQAWVVGVGLGVLGEFEQRGQAVRVAFQRSYELGAGACAVVLALVIQPPADRGCAARA